MSKIHNTRIVGKVLLEFDHLESTNAYARALLQQSPLEEGTVVLARDQSKGRGQLGTTWDSEPGKNLTLSIVLNPHFLAISDQFRLNKIVALSVREAIMEYIPDEVKIKWPNDILINEKKVAGILIQNILKGSTVHTVIAGIGLNVNQQDFGPSLLTATSLSQLLGNTLDLDEVLQTLLEKLDRYYELLELYPTRIDDVYHEHLYLRGIESMFFTPDSSRFIGTIRTVDAQGRLEVIVKNELKYFTLKEIKFA